MPETCCQGAGIMSQQASPRACAMETTSSCTVVQHSRTAGIGQRQRSGGVAARPARSTCCCTRQQVTASVGTRRGRGWQCDPFTHSSSMGYRQILQEDEQKRSALKRRTQTKTRRDKRTARMCGRAAIPPARLAARSTPRIPQPLTAQPAVRPATVPSGALLRNPVPEQLGTVSAGAAPRPSAAQPPRRRLPTTAGAAARRRTPRLHRPTHRPAQRPGHAPPLLRPRPQPPAARPAPLGHRAGRTPVRAERGPHTSWPRPSTGASIRARLRAGQLATPAWPHPYASMPCALRKAFCGAVTSSHLPCGDRRAQLARHRAQCHPSHIRATFLAAAYSHAHSRRQKPEQVGPRGACRRREAPRSAPGRRHASSLAAALPSAEAAQRRPHGPQRRGRRRALQPPRVRHGRQRLAPA
jgi:hypothetical protein